MSRYCLYWILTLFAALGCTKDDLCPEDTPTTPLLIISFNDINDRLSTKAVTDLQIRLTDADQTIVREQINDTIARIPLNTASDNTEFEFILNASETEDANIDTVSFSYLTEDVYINRACGFKTIYNNFITDIVEEGFGENWILDFDILAPEIDDETITHLIIYH